MSDFAIIIRKFVKKYRKINYLCYTYIILGFLEVLALKKLQKRYYILVFVLAILAGMLLRSVENNSFKIVKNSTVYAPEGETVSFAEDSDTEKKININTADIYELSRLSGIGEGLGERIVNFRTKNGKFEVIQDIMKVPGIGEKTFLEIKDYICVE